MEHKLTSIETSTENVQYDIYVLELDSNIVNIGIKRIDFCNDLRSNELSLNLNKKELHSFIGTLLHVQQKMKGSV